MKLVRGGFDWTNDLNDSKLILYALECCCNNQCVNELMQSQYIKLGETSWMESPIPYHGFQWLKLP